MLKEIKIALDFVKSYLHNLPKDQINVFMEKLEQLLVTKFEGHWYPEKPSKGSAFRSISIGNAKIDDLIKDAANHAGLNIDVLKSAFSYDLLLWVDPHEVSYRIGENGNIKILHKTHHSNVSSPQNTFNRAGLYGGDDISLLNNPFVNTSLGFNGTPISNSLYSNFHQYESPIASSPQYFNANNGSLYYPTMTPPNLHEDFFYPQSSHNSTLKNKLFGSDFKQRIDNGGYKKCHSTLSDTNIKRNLNFDVLMPPNMYYDVGGGDTLNYNCNTTLDMYNNVQPSSTSAVYPYMNPIDYVQQMSYSNLTTESQACNEIGNHNGINFGLRTSPLSFEEDNTTSNGSMNDYMSNFYGSNNNNAYLNSNTMSFHNLIAMENHGRHNSDDSHFYGVASSESVSPKSSITNATTTSYDMKRIEEIASKLQHLLVAN